MGLEISNQADRRRRVYKEYLADSPVFFAPMDDPSNPLRDLSTNNLAITRMSTSAVPRIKGPGGVSSGCRGDGIGYFQVTGSNPILQITGNVTLSLWFRPKTIGTIQGISGIRNQAASTGPYAMNFNSSVTQWYYGTGSSYFVNSIAWPVVPRPVWYHFVGTRTSGVMQQYLNGVPNGTGTDGSATPPVAATATPFYMFIDAPENGGEFDGDLAYVAVYGSALSAARVLAQYNVVYEKLSWLLKNPR